MKTFAELYPALSPIELPEAEYNFRRYLEIVAAIAREQGGSVEDATGSHGWRDSCCGLTSRITNLPGTAS
jgi:hypothetical protein